MPAHEAPCVELGNVPEGRSPALSPSPSASEVSSGSSPEPQHIRAPPLFRVLAMPPPEPQQPPGQDELERRLPGYRRIVIPRDLTLIELLKQYSGVRTDDEVLSIREAKLRVVAERVGLRRIHVFAPRLRSLTLDGSAISSLRDLGIGLVKLKFLSINRCGLTSLDGIWGLTALQELHATNNKIQDLQPLAVMQKLYTLDLANNPISQSSRVWTLGVCSSLRKLTLRGTPASTASDYRSRVASVLPMLVYLDDEPLHTDVEYDIDTRDRQSSSSESEDEPEDQVSLEPLPTPGDAGAGPSSAADNLETPHEDGPDGDTNVRIRPATATEGRLRRRPATADGVGLRPDRPPLPPRPHTAQTRSRGIKPLTRLEIMNTLLDDEWRCSGSALTSQGTVCGNIAQALRRSTYQRNFDVRQIVKEMEDETLKDAARAIAAEIPRAPILEDWAKFREATGIDIDIDFNARPKDSDPNKAIERLEQIEQETKERLLRESLEEEEKSKKIEERSLPETVKTFSSSDLFEPDNAMNDVLSYDFDTWRGIEELAPSGDRYGDVDAIFHEPESVQSRSDRRRSFGRDVSNQGR